MDTFSFDPAAPLKQADGESRAANQALQDYVYMGAGRSLRKLLAQYSKQIANKQQTAKPPTSRWSTLAGWSSKYAWQSRLDAWLALKRQQDAELWDERQDEIRSADWELGETLRKLATRILGEAPNFLKAKQKIVRGKRDKDGNQLEPDQVIITLAIDANLAVKAGEAASKLQRLAAGLETEIESHDHQVQVSVYLPDNERGDRRES
ncbi:MAG: hypothetical protein OEZ02_00865 [Anaerolineae bacterium]|nr:hypothetical protein [Anaerolineae bacterium]